MSIDTRLMSNASVEVVTHNRGPCQSRLAISWRQKPQPLLVRIGLSWAFTDLGSERSREVP